MIPPIESGMEQGPSGRAVVESLLEILQAEETIRVPATGNSMGRRFEAADTVEIHQVEPGREPHPGEVVAINEGNRLVVHRIIRIKRTAAGVRITTKGDAARHADAPEDASRIAGYVTAILKDGHRVSQCTLRARLHGVVVACKGRLGLLVRRIPPHRR